ncbi:MAG: hypothetical protein ACOCTI_01345, partial [Phycisphaeraceae bacterium]
TDIRDDVRSLKEGLGKLQDDLRSLAQSVMGAGRRSAEQAGASDTQIDDVLRQAKEQITRRPAATVAIAFVVGLMAAWLLGRK